MSKQCQKESNLKRKRIEKQRIKENDGTIQTALNNGSSGK
jgi:hypothetical protein